VKADKKMAKLHKVKKGKWKFKGITFKTKTAGRKYLGAKHIHCRGK
jgi:hypothetical protein